MTDLLLNPIFAALLSGIPAVLLAVRSGGEDRHFINGVGAGLYAGLALTLVWGVVFLFFPAPMGWMMLFLAWKFILAHTLLTSAFVSVLLHLLEPRRAALLGLFASAFVSFAYFAPDRLIRF